MTRRWLVGTLAVAMTSCAAKDAARMIIEGETKTLHERGKGARPSAPETPPLLFIAFDGVSRELLYDMLRKGQLPNFAQLLGGDSLQHAHLDETVLSTLPSSTMAAWATMMTGLTPAQHGVAGNEYFARESETFACPAPVSFDDMAPTFEILLDGYMNHLIDGPTIYDQMKEQSPDSLIWVAMHSVFRGADKLLMARRTVIVKAAESFVTSTVKEVSQGKPARDVFAKLDGEVLQVVEEQVTESSVMPDVLTVYLSGTDLYAHVAKEGPDEARRAYLREVVDPQLKNLVDALQKRDALVNRWVIVSSDHGHTEVERENNIDAIPPLTILAKAGFRIRPPQREIEKDTPYNAVIALGGAMAYVYVADRSTCPGERDRCAWASAPRYAEDVIPAADAFYRANLDGTNYPSFKGRLDLVLTRKPKPAREVDNPFEVYVGNGKTQPLDEYLHDHPHPTYVQMEQRMRDLGVGVHGDHAGDVLLLANNGNVDDPKLRYYFAHPYKSWHGSPSRSDSEIPLIVANRGFSTEAIGAWVKDALGERPSQQGIGTLMVKLRAHPPTH